MANAREIREKLRELIEGRASLQQFQEWFVPATWDVHRESDPETEALVDEIELNLSEYSGSHLRAEELGRALGELAIASHPFVSPIESTAVLLRVPQNLVAIETAVAVAVPSSNRNVWLWQEPGAIVVRSANSSMPDVPLKAPGSANSSVPLELAAVA